MSMIMIRSGWMLFLCITFTVKLSSFVVMGQSMTSKQQRLITIYSTIPSNKEYAAVARKQMHDIHMYQTQADNTMINVHYLTTAEQRSYIQSHINECSTNALHIFDSLQNINHHIQTEIFKWCALSTTTSTTGTTTNSKDDIIAYIDSSCPIMNMSSIRSLLSIDQRKNVAVVDESTSTIHGSYLQMFNTKENQNFAKQMLHFIVNQIDIDVLQSHAILIPRTLYETIHNKMKQSWYLLQLSCRKQQRNNMIQSNDVVRDHFTCSIGYCCSIQDTTAGTTVLLSRNYILPNQMIPQSTGTGNTNNNNVVVPQPINIQAAKNTAEINKDIPFIATVTVKELDVETKNRNKNIPNFYDLLEKDNCLPSHDSCTKCLREKKGASCDTCQVQCQCYCSKLCKTKIPSKPIVQEWMITPPQYTLYPTRIIPKIIHQTWFEYLDPTSYPNMSRLIESFKQSGWDYRFYTDDDIIDFLTIHFPSFVVDAYNTLIPGAFKADLFRYCVLLIYGGVYADVDIHLQSFLDISIPDDAGFMVPIDEVRKR
jgi:Glycosyltransferase sugar-binding region containing DXD motif